MQCEMEKKRILSFMNNPKAPASLSWQLVVHSIVSVSWRYLDKLQCLTIHYTSPYQDFVSTHLYAYKSDVSRTKNNLI
jgi:hypothetical protein